jgi:hypothetical protein
MSLKKNVKNILLDEFVSQVKEQAIKQEREDTAKYIKQFMLETKYSEGQAEYIAKAIRERE